MSATAKTQRSAPADKREAIMAAALELFVDRGFHGTAVPEIAEKAGVGAGTIYRYFANKEALVNAIYRSEKERYASRVHAELSKTAGSRELFRTLWNRMAAFAVENPRPFIFMELHHHAEYLDADNQALEERLHALFANIIGAAQKRGELKDGSPNVLMAIVMGAFVGVIRHCVNAGTSLHEADWAFAERCVWEAIRA